MSLCNRKAVRRVNSKTFVCDKHDRPIITLVLVAILTQSHCVLFFCKNICLKEGEIWQNCFFKHTYSRLTYKVLSSSFLSLRLGKFTNDKLIKEYLEMSHQPSANHFSFVFIPAAPVLMILMVNSDGGVVFWQGYFAEYRMLNDSKV